MSCNIYEDPDLNMKVRYNKGTRGKVQEKVEKVVDIYESAETLNGPRVNACRKVRGAKTQKRPRPVQRNLYKPAALILALVCFLLLAGFGVLLYLLISLKADQPDSTCEVNNQNNTDWQEIRTSRFFYTSTEKKNWTESRKDCQNRGGDLVKINSKEKQDILRTMKIHGDSWIGLQAVDAIKYGDKGNWQWADGSAQEYRFWKTGVSTRPEAGSKVYINQEVLGLHSKTGLKHWICERRNISHNAVINP